MPLNTKRVAGIQEILNADIVRPDGYTSKLVEYELVERKGDQLLSKVIQKGSLNLHIRKEEDPNGRVSSLFKQLDSSLGQFDQMAVVHLEGGDTSSDSTRDLNAIKETIKRQKTKVQ